VWVPARRRSGLGSLRGRLLGLLPTFGYTWVSGYPWGWLPYHCGAWGYYPFGWGWAPGGCGRLVSGDRGAHLSSRAGSMPVRPVFPGGGLHPLPAQRLVAVDRGPVAKGPWAFGRSSAQAGPSAGAEFNGRTIAPVGRVDVRVAGICCCEGHSAGDASCIERRSCRRPQRPSSNSAYWGCQSAACGGAAE
jgi:hypothetical protein